ncbi:VCBS domain-containing protein [Microvirga sp. P5_D2]
MSDTSQNYTPVITGGEFTASFAEPASSSPTAAVSAEGVITFTDADIADARDVTVVSEPIGANGVVFNASVSDDANGDTPGEILWTVSVLPGYLDGLAEGETRELIYTLELVDDAGATARQNVTITLTGTNDAPVITGGKATASFTEPVSGQPTSVVSAEGAITFKDVDIADARDVTVVSEPADAEGVIFSASVSEDANGNASGEILWTVSVLPNYLNSLAQGETRELVYTLELIDDAGATERQNVTITLTGTNDAPVITGGVFSASFAEPVVGQPTTVLSKEGVITFTDVDVADVRDVNVVSEPTDADGVIFTASVTEDASGDAAGEITWTVSVEPGLLDSLAEGETRTLVYTLELVDDSNATVQRDVTITLTGTNDVPLVTGAVTGVATEGDVASTLNALQNASDVDTIDVLNVVGIGTLPAGVTYDAETHSFTLDPSHPAYKALSEGQATTVTVEYGVSDGRATTPASVSWTVTGTGGGTTVGSVSDGYIANAFVFIDKDNDGEWDEDEASTITDAEGRFTLDHDGLGTLVTTTRPDGGVAIDLATQLPFTGTLKAPSGYSVVTPVTTIVQALVRPGMTVEQAEAAVATAFGITLAPGQSLANLDPLAASVDPNASPAAREAAQNLFKAGAMVLNTITMIVSAAAGQNPSGQVTNDVMSAVVSALAAEIDAGTLDMASGGAGSLGNLISEAFSAAGKPAPDADFVDSIAGIVASINTAVQNASGSAAEILTQVTKISVVAQSDEGAAGSLATATPETIGAVADQFSGASLESAIEQAEIGHVVDNPDNTAPEAEANKSLVVAEEGIIALGITEPTDANNDGLKIVVSRVPDSSKGRVYLADGVTAVVAGQELTADELQGLVFKTVANAEGAAGSFAYTVSDPFGGTDTQAIALSITPVADAPTDIGLAGGSVFENAAAGTVVASLSAFDVDAGDSFNFTLLNNAGGRFAIQGNQIVVANGTLLDYEQAQSHQVVVRATDRSGLSVDKVFTLSVADLVNEVAAGAPGPDYLVGGAGNDILNGGLGNDFLTGGAGKDIFLFKDKLNKSTNVDTITDFSVRDDTIQLDNKIFTKLEKTGTLSKSNFVVGTKALDANDHIIYDKKKGYVYYDADGSGNGKAVLFAKVKKGLSLTEKDFRVVNEKIVGDEGNNTLTGSVNKDNLSGEGGDDRLNGGAGNDRLTGGLGNDAFVFRDKLNKSTNVDTITDFSVQDDTIHLENGIFRQLKKTGDLSKSFFTVGTNAKDKNDYIVYDKKKGYLYYDADGSGQGEKVLFAKITKGLSLTEKDFFVI